MNQLSLLLSIRYLVSRQKDSTISFMIKMCLLSITIGSFALMLTLIITNGFEQVISEKMRNINAEVIIFAPPNTQLDAASLRTTLLAKFPHKVLAAAGNSTHEVLIDRNNQQSLFFLRGIEPQYEAMVTTLEKKIVASLLSPKQQENNEAKSIHSLEKLLKKNQILIGQKTAANLKLKIGDTVTLLIPETGKGRKITLSKRKGKIAGIFKVGIDEFDSGFIFSSIDFLRELFGKQEGVDQLALKLSPDLEAFSLWQLFSVDFYYNLFRGLSAERALIRNIKKLFPELTVNSWEDLYPALVASLKLEKYAMFFIIVLISLVASMNMIALLFIQIQHKRRDIAILQVMGMPGKKICNIFLNIGLSITLLGSFVGLSLAVLVGKLLERYPFIKLPDVYYVSHLPARVDVQIVFVVWVCTLLLGFLSTWIPSRRTQSLNIHEILRLE